MHCKFVNLEVFQFVGPYFYRRKEWKLVWFFHVSVFCLSCGGSQSRGNSNKIIKIMKEILYLRLKCGEFLLLLIGHVNGRDSPPLATIHEDTRRLLGEKSASLIWAASQFGSTLDPEQRLTALQIQARRVLESLDLYWMLRITPSILGNWECAPCCFKVLYVYSPFLLQW